MSYTVKGDKKFNLNVVPLWPTTNGNFKSIKIKPEHYDAIQQIQEGGMLLFKFLPEHTRKHEDSPVAMLEYVTPEALNAYAAKARENGNVFAKPRVPKTNVNVRPTAQDDDIV